MYQEGNVMEFIQELKKLGLKDKESAVYLASLELGPAPVQNIARKAKVVRATTYVILEDLMQKGLITHYKEGKKTLFSAEPPRQLMRLIEVEESTLQERKRGLELVLPELQMVMKAAGEKPSVRYFEGKEGLHVMRQEIIMYTGSGATIYNFTPMDHLHATFSQDDDAFFRQRVAKRIPAKTLFTTRSDKLRQSTLKGSKPGISEYRFIPAQSFPSTSGMTIFEDRIAIGTFVGKQMGVVVESEPMAEMMRRIFDLAWKGAESVDGKK